MQESTSTCASQYVSTYTCRVGLYIGTVWADVGFKKYLPKILRCSSVCRTRSTRVHWQGVTHLTSIRDSGSLISLSLRIRRHAYDNNMGRLHCFDLHLSAFQKCRLEDLLSIVIHINDKKLRTIDSNRETRIIVNKDSDGDGYFSITFWFPDFWHAETPWGWR